MKDKFRKMIITSGIILVVTITVIYVFQLASLFRSHEPIGG
ncbi:MAG: hypothetical protein ACTSVI_02270 [Promethearchaeota archaeon]